LVGFTPGNIALIDRGVCAFVIKAAAAQAAGAIAVVVADNEAGSPPAGLGGTDPSITIPVVRITLADANAIKAQLGSGVSVTLTLDPLVYAGADASGRVLMNAPNPLQPGSSVSHWDPVTFPNQLMEPAINGDLTHSLVPPIDLTLGLMRDIGWFPDVNLDGIPDATDPIPTATPHLSVARLAMGEAVVRWEAQTLPDFSTFRVYRQTQGGLRTRISGDFAQGSGSYEFRDMAAPASGAEYWLQATRGTGSEAWFGPAILSAATLPSMRLAVSTAPFRPGSAISFSLPTNRAAELGVYNLAGRQVATLVHGAMGAGDHLVSWDGRAADGGQVAAGVYMLRLSDGAQTLTQKLLLLH
jgi:hypothetical protein